MVSVLFVGIVIGLVLGLVADYIYIKYGWKPVLVLSLALVAATTMVIWQTDLDATAAVGVMLAYASTRFLAEPMLKRHVQP
jgi:galactitol-specific phosphotransferase system IIC component